MKQTNLLLLTGFGFLAILVIVFSSLSLGPALAQTLGLESNFIAPTQEYFSSELEKATVERVVDGDTIQLTDGRTVRYLNLDTPETKKPSVPVMCYGLEASNFNKKEVEGKQIWLGSDKENKDRYGRYLRFIFLNENDTKDITKSLNATLVRNGFARVSIYKPNNTYEKVFWELEREAKDQNRGIWKACPKPFES